METNKPATVDAYITSFPKEVQIILQQMRDTVHAAAPDAEECISYGMPTYNQHGVVVHFAAFAKHIGFYATPTGHEAFKEDLAGYKQGRGSVQFPLNKPMPWDLISRIVEFRVAENVEKAKLRSSKPRKTI